MNRIVWTLPFWFLFCSTLTHGQPLNPPAHRVVILKVDGLNADLLYGAMRQRDPSTGKPCLPWLSHIFVDQGVIYENFYTRGISLSAPSWSMLDTGQHTIIHGNVEYDRYTGHIYDYLNFFPFYLRNAWAKEVDMPGVEVLDRAGIPLLIDHFRYQQVYQSFQLFQRGVRWATLTSVLKRKFSSKSMLSLIEGGGPSLGELWAQQTEKEIDAALQDRDTEYLDFFTGDLDHTGHATNNPAAMLAAMEQLDVLAGRLWTAIQASPLAEKTVFIIVSDHGMNNDPGVVSQGFSLPDVFNSPEGGAHHVMTNRHPLTDYKLRGLDPLVERAFSPSEASFYLKDQGWHYLTAWLDLDGNERASVQLRNSDLNKIHILLLQLSLNGLSGPIRRAATAALNETIDRHRQAWTDIADQLAQELSELQRSIEERKILVHQLPKKWTREQHALGEHRKAKRLNRELAEWTREYDEYSDYLKHLRRLLDLELDPARVFDRKISDYVPEFSLGDRNSLSQLQNYIVGPGPSGLILNPDGGLDEERSFRYVDNFNMLVSRRVRNNPQAALSSRPIDFIAVALDDHTYWLYGDRDSQLLITTNANGDISLRPVANLAQDSQGTVTWKDQQWKPALPLHLYEDPQLQLPTGEDRASWLSGWHSERDWLNAIHRCLYSNGVIGITEELATVATRISGPRGLSPVLLRHEHRRRELVQPDFEVFAANHWNFNVRNFNPGGNHGAFFRISTHSVWMMAGAGLPATSVEEPHDSLDFAPVIFKLTGHYNVLSGPNAGAD